MDDQEHKKRRYCLICHTFKPDRTHHCSVCNRCVLNMDHHCPWVNNCVGFRNRKYFLLLIFYATIDILLINLVYIQELYEILNVIREKGLSIWSFMFVVPQMFLFPLFFVLVNFTYFHINAVLNNMTTIESLEEQRSKIGVSKSKYDLGRWINWVQVFGMNPYYWLVPIYGESGQPVGDGVLWEQRERQESL